MSTSFTQVFGGSTIYPSDVSYLALSLNSDTTLEWPLEATTGNNVVARIIDVTPTGVFTIFMPDATKVGVGQTILFNNLGPDIVTVDTAAGNAILSMNAGEQWQIYLTDNTTAAGTWRVFRYGAATAQAQASALAGPGIIALGSELAQNAEVLSFSATPRTGTTGDRAKTLVWTGGLGTLTLPSAVSATNGWFINLRNGGTGDLTVDPSGTELINGGSTLTLQPGDSASIVTNGIQWYSIGLGQQAVFAFDYTSVSVAPGGTYTLSGSELNRIAYKFTGTLTSNSTVVVPATVQQYWVNNQTTGAFTLSLLVSGSSTPVVVPQNTTGIYYSDGSNIVPATTAAAFAGVLGITQGGTGATTAPSALGNLGGTGIGTSVFTAATTAAARTAIAAAASGANSDITSLTGLTTPLSVAQGGTGGTTQSTARAGIAAAASGSNGDITALTNAAGIQVGAPTGGAQGVGTLNATGLFINGVGVGTGSGSVTSINVSGGTTGLTASGGPVTTSGTITLGGTLAVANGGTGQTTYTDGQLLIGNSTGNTLTKATLTAGSGISITNGNGSITITSTAGGGTVTSVSGSGGSTGLTLTGGPITGAGTLTLGGTLAIANGGTGAATASGARLNLDAPSTSGSGATGTWGINITGIAASATTATTANALNASNSYSIAGLESTAPIGVTTPNAGTSGGFVLRGNATSGNAILQVRDSTGVSQWGFATVTVAGTFTWSGQMTATQFNGSGAGLTGTASSLSIGGNAATVTNGVYTTGSQTISGQKLFSSLLLLGDGGFAFNSDGAQDTGISWASDGVMNVRSNGVTIGQFNGSGFTGNAATATTATTANALNTGNNYQVNSLGVGTAGSGTAGEIRATNNITAYYSSDARLKENVQPITDALGVVSAVGGKTFDWTDAYIADHGGEDGYFVRKSDFGVIAQDVEAVFPLAVRTREDGTKAVDYEKLVAVAFAAIAELEAKVAELQQQAVKVIKP